MTEQELNKYLLDIAIGCKWYQEHPECFEEYDNGFMIRVISSENIPSEAQLYVDFCNNRTLYSREKDNVLKSMGLSGNEYHNPQPPRKIKWGTK